MVDKLKRKMVMAIMLDLAETILCSADSHVVERFQQFHVSILHYLKLFRNRVHDYKDRFGKQILPEVEFLFPFYWLRGEKLESFARIDFYNVFQKVICGEQQEIRLFVPKSKRAEFYSELESLRFGWQDIIDIFVTEIDMRDDVVTIELIFKPCFEKGTFLHL
ncbi:MAG: hypothetical protein WC663_05995 [Patescibacteria group bacterium]